MENNDQPTNTQSTSALKRTVLIIIGLLLVGVMAVGVVTLLRNIAPKAPETPSKSALSAEEVINKLKTPGTIKLLDNFSQQDSQGGGSRITYKSNDRAYAVSVSAKDSVLFVAKTPGPYSDAHQTEEEIASFMNEKGYEKTENTQLNTAGMPTHLTFTSQLDVCQVTSLQPTQDQQTFAFYEVGCVKKSAFSEEYSTIEMLLALYKETNQLPSFNDVSRSNNTEDNKSLSVVNLRGDATRKLLLFAAIDNRWEFIGDLNSAGASSNGKYAISPEVQNKINDARFGDFLRKFIK